MTQRIPALIVLFTLTACGPNLAQEPAASFQARVDSAVTATDTGSTGVPNSLGEQPNESKLASASIPARTEPWLCPRNTEAIATRL